MARGAGPGVDGSGSVAASSTAGGAAKNKAGKAKKANQHKKADTPRGGKAPVVSTGKSTGGKHQVGSHVERKRIFVYDDLNWSNGKQPHLPPRGPCNTLRVSRDATAL